MPKQKKIISGKGEVAFSPDWLSDITNQIASSPIANPYKVVFLYSIAQGTFDLDLYEKFQSLLTRYREDLVKESKNLDEEIAELEREYAEIEKNLPKAAFLASQEITSAATHIVTKTAQELERRKETRSSQQIEKLTARIKKKP